MIPRPEQALADLAGRIGTRLLPELQDPYAGADAGLISLLMTMLSGELESGVARRLTDGAELKALFSSATGAPERDARAGFITSEPRALTLTEVTAWLDEGLSLLIELHSWAEDADPDLNERIWAFLHAHTQLHKFDF